MPIAIIRRTGPNHTLLLADLAPLQAVRCPAYGRVTFRLRKKDRSAIAVSTETIAQRLRGLLSASSEREITPRFTTFLHSQTDCFLTALEQKSRALRDRVRVDPLATEQLTDHAEQFLSSVRHLKMIRTRTLKKLETLIGQVRLAQYHLVRQRAAEADVDKHAE